MMTLFAVMTITLILPQMLDQYFNKVASSGSASPVSEHALKLHATLLIVDLHADSLLWNRDLLARNNRGHVDVPRLIEGNVALQAFTIVTKVPSRVQLEHNNADSDDVTLLAIAQCWPPVTWNNLLQRAIYQADKLVQFAKNSKGKLTVIRTATELRSYLEKRKKNAGCTAGIIGVEGAHALEGNLDNVDVLFDHGIRMMAPTHFFDNDIGSSAHGLVDRGLTDKGKEMIRRMQQKGMVVDVAHASIGVINDVIAMAGKPVVVSHTGVKGTCNNVRNLSDEQLKGIAKTGGVIGIGYWRTAVCGDDAKAIAGAIKYTAKLAGVEHVALGSDFDGTVTMPFDASGLVALTQALMDEGFSDNDIRLIMGENSLRVWEELLPE